MIVDTTVASLRADLKREATAIVPFFIAMRSQAGKVPCDLLDVIDRAPDPVLVILAPRIRGLLNACVNIAHEGGCQ